MIERTDGGATTKAMEPLNRPKDVDGDPVIMGKWYWMMNHAGHIVGAGTFMAAINGTKILFYMNYAGYSPDGMKFAKAECPKLLFAGKAGG